MADSTTFFRLNPTGSPVSPAFEYRTTRAAAGGGDIIVLPTGLRRGVSVILKVTSGSGSVQYTTNPRSEFETAVAAITWITWTNGTVTVDTQNQFGPISALRINSVSGSQTLLIQAD